jgi:hypothetical protein
LAKAGKNSKQVSRHQKWLDSLDSWWFMLNLCIFMLISKGVYNPFSTIGDAHRSWAWWAVCNTSRPPEHRDRANEHDLFEKTVRSQIEHEGFVTAPSGVIHVPTTSYNSHSWDREKSQVESAEWARRCYATPIRSWLLFLSSLVGSSHTGHGTLVPTRKHLGIFSSSFIQSSVWPVWPYIRVAMS